MLYREIMAVCSEIHIKHINTVCGQNVQLLNVELGGTPAIQLAWKDRKIKILTLKTQIQYNTIITKFTVQNVSSFVKQLIHRSYLNVYKQMHYNKSKSY
jgi:hypothetical protein